MNRISHDKRTKVIGLLRDGMSIRNVVRTVGVSRQTVNTIRKGLSLGKGALFDVARPMGFSEDTIYRWLRSVETLPTVSPFGCLSPDASEWGVQLREMSYFVDK